MGTLQEMKKMQLLVDNYISETLSYIPTVQGFLHKESEWFCKREKEMNKMKDIRKKANNMTIKLSIRMKKLEKELSAVVKDVISGLKELQPFLEALEKLAVTSTFVFDERLCWLPAGNTVTDVISFIHAARMSCGLLVYFRKDTEKFFQPSLDNVEILVSELQEIICFSQDICKIMEKRCKNKVFPRWNSGEQHTCLQFYLHLSPDAVNMMSNHVNNLSKIRANEDFRLAFMFRDEEKSLKFIAVLSEQKTKILGSLAQMEACAVQLDKMKKGADISGVAGSTVGVGGGVVSIVGLALAPVTLGASTILTVIGGVLGALSGVNSVATGFTQLRINAHEKNKFKEICNSFLEDLKPVLECLAEVMIIKDLSVENDMVDHGTDTKKTARKWEDHAKKARIIAAGVSSLYKVIDVAVDCSKAAKLADAASDLADIGTKVAGKTVSTSLRGIFIAGGAAFIGLDLISITMNSISLSNGSKSDVSKAIRGHVDFWKIHLDAWEQICDSLHRGKQDFQESKTILGKPFYPEL
uniref:Apolipoprotein L n=1 Tax=Paramormyrops kingsleyae TaxID=1676925 RepID=A0A3B3S225_9TELE|nr:uncharacterized protein LOC111835979 isoform X1 [Paramormyrops kingsleyae]XP_023652605.1 uncharacterized protein LOC111835979 isoform X1 [Paramormyrops kingsleyae]XP_023652606.1 uncharacterized protein LOC111835979 isoform X1 [Paramormyrops kingsleyae]XP_023652607.1 uncharacterized protein LOC111835979 isoform X1 [Paramormyrops kingsleyae]XP_023652608.1 uncharacterized protein LOC111835979 isoform X1 [Paramormyrops kingsleyae]XP_023652609.1 uncharacterized protein LOC111835979 isoform X2 [P